MSLCANRAASKLNIAYRCTFSVQWKVSSQGEKEIFIFLRRQGVVFSFEVCFQFPYLGADSVPRGINKI